MEIGDLRGRYVVGVLLRYRWFFLVYGILINFAAVNRVDVEMSGVQFPGSWCLRVMFIHFSVSSVEDGNVKCIS